MMPHHSMTGKEPSKGLILAAFAALYLIWGSTYLAILLAIKTIPPFLMAGTRFFVAGVLLYAWCRMKGQAQPGRSSTVRIALSGVLMLFMGTGAVVWVEQYIPSGLAAIIVATVPLWFVILDKREWKFYFSNKWIITGLLIGFAGVLLLFSGQGTEGLMDDRMQVISFFVLIAGTITWAVGSLYSKYSRMEGSPAMKAALQMIAAGIVSFVFGLLWGEHRDFSWQAVTSESLWALLYLIVFGSLIGYMSYIWLLGVRAASQVGTYAYVNPVVAVFLGWLLAGEAITTLQVVALVVILGGVILVNLFKEKR